MRTRTVPLWMCMWPGLTGLWLVGEWTALLSAIAFATLFNFALVIVFVYPDWFSREVKLIAWTSIGLFWLISFLRTRGKRDLFLDRMESNDADDDVELHEAQTEYLAGEWKAAETIVEEILLQNPRDVEARLLLISIFRRQDRLPEARRQIEIASQYDGAVRWRDEIDLELESIELAEQKHAEQLVHQTDDVGSIRQRASGILRKTRRSKQSSKTTQTTDVDVNVETNTVSRNAVSSAQQNRSGNRQPPNTKKQPSNTNSQTIDSQSQFEAELREARESLYGETKSVRAAEKESANHDVSTGVRVIGKKSLENLPEEVRKEFADYSDLLAISHPTGISENHKLETIEEATNDSNLSTSQKLKRKLAQVVSPRRSSKTSGNSKVA